MWRCLWRLASQINGQLDTGAPSTLSYSPIAIPDLRDHWLDHHEQVLRSSVQSINRYRTATEHLVRFLATRPIRHAGLFQAGHAEEFVRHLRSIRVSPNGHSLDGWPLTSSSPVMKSPFLAIQWRGWFGSNRRCNQKHIMLHGRGPQSEGMYKRTM